MFQRHAGRRLDALIDAELPPAEAARLEAHIAGCRKCRDARDRHAGVAAMLRRLEPVAAPAEVWTAIEAALDGGAGSSPSARQAQVDRSRRVSGAWRHRWQHAMRPMLALAGVLAIAVAAAVFWPTRNDTGRDVARLDAAGRESTLAPGEWVETDAASRVVLRIGSIGTVDVAPNTRMQLVGAQRDEHRLRLARGTISAQILAPPRLFFVETPASTVVDLGCAYTMTVDDAGAGLLRVTGGWASLESDGRESLVPAGASCPTRPGVGPGTPSFDDASAALKGALFAFDFEDGGRPALDTILSEARVRDTLTLWHLLSRVDPGDRRRVLDRMVALTPMPKGVDRDRVLALDRDSLTRWREELAWTW